MPRPDPGVINSLTSSSLSSLLPCCHWISSLSFKSYCICLVPINLTLSLCLPFRFSTPPHHRIHLAGALPFPEARPPLRYSQSHLQSDIFNGLISLSSRGLIERLTSTPHILRPRRSFFTSAHSRASGAFFSPPFHLSFMLSRSFHFISSPLNLHL